MPVMPLRLWGPNAARFDLRNHRKIVVVDGACAYFGSQNIVSAHANRGMVNEEMLVRATGPIVRHLHAVLLGDRYLETGNLPPESDDLTGAAGRRHTRRARPGGAERAGLQRGHGRGGDDRAHVRRAVAGGADVALRDSRASRSSARCAAPRAAACAWTSSSTANRTSRWCSSRSSRTTTRCWPPACGIHRHSGSFLHAKHMSVDDDVALIGSSNLDIRSFALNAEVSVLIYDRRSLPRRCTGCRPATCAGLDPVTREERARAVARRGARWRTSRG